VAEPPAYAATGEQPLAGELRSWMETWAPARPVPLTSPV
jgi:hypothetical protein